MSFYALYMNGFIDFVAMEGEIIFWFFSLVNFIYTNKGV